MERYFCCDKKKTYFLRT